MSKDNDLFSLNIFEGTKPNDVKNLPINEEGEFAPQSYAQTGADNGVKDGSVSVPGGTGEKPTAKPEGGEHGPSVPSGDGSGKGENYGPSIPKGTELTTDEWNHAMSALKQSFKEGYELMGMLESCRIVEKTVEQKQAEFMENAVDEAILASFENGPIFEAVDRGDKTDVKKIVGKVRSKIKQAFNDVSGMKFYDAKVVARAMSNSGDTVSGIWTNRLWQVIGMVHVESGNIKEACASMTKKFADELGKYKVLYAKASPAVVDLVRTRFKINDKKPAYFLLIDKSVPQDIKDAIKALETAANASDGAKKDDPKDGKKEPAPKDEKAMKESSDNESEESENNDESEDAKKREKALKESMYSCDESDFED